MADETPDALRAMALASRAASRALQALSSEERVAILHRIADGLLASQDAILAGACALGVLRHATLTHVCCALRSERGGRGGGQGGRHRRGAAGASVPHAG